MFGTGLGGVQVATMTASMSPGASPASATAARPACAEMSTSVSSGAHMWRLTMPTRSRIHWSLVSIVRASSSLVTTRSGR